MLKIQSLETILATSTGLSQDKRDQYQKQIEDLAKYIESKPICFRGVTSVAFEAVVI